MSFADDSGRVDAWGAGSAANGRDDVQGPGTWSQKGASDNFDGHNADFGDSNKENNANFGIDDQNGRCFNCGEDGHFKSQCPSHRRKFTGACKNCGEEGHTAASCDRPRKSAGPCRNCGEDGHNAAVCQRPRKIDRSHIPDVTADDAWNELMKAIKERDMDDVKAAVEKYSKACPEMTYLQLQEGILDSGLSLFLIAKERPLLPTYTNMDLQGNLNKKYSISYRFSDKPQRPIEAEGWPETREDLLSRLNDAGIVVDSPVPYCTKCGEMGHVRKHCKEEGMGEVERPQILCFNCNTTGHRMRDCPEPRSTKGPRSAANIECRKCGETGHKAKDCPEEKDKSSSDFHTRRSELKDVDEANDSNQLGCIGDAASPNDGGWSHGAPAGNGDWDAATW